MQKMKFSLSKTNDPLVMNWKKKKKRKCIFPKFYKPSDFCSQQITRSASEISIANLSATVFGKESQVGRKRWFGS